MNVKRAILKTISYRILGSCVSFSIGYFFTKDLSSATIIGLGDLVVKPFVYMAHELLWQKVPQK
jgi:uncharacterized membrane protein